MKMRTIFVATLLLLGFLQSTAALKIDDDSGGQIGTYLAKYRALRASGERVEIVGTCASACTMVLGIIPRNLICVAPGAKLVFHSAWDAENDRLVTADGNRILWRSYPASVRQWITRHGGLRNELLTLSGRDLAAMFPNCHN